MLIDYQAMGERIKECRKNKHLTQEKMAEMLNISVSFISRIERGNVKVSLETLAKISNILDVSPSYFIDGVIYANDRYLKNELINTIKNFSKEKKQLMLELAEAVRRY